MMAKQTIFLHSLFRTGSTYIWNKFRRNGNLCCYYEPLHQDLKKIRKNRLDIWGFNRKITNREKHPELDQCHFFEYGPIFESGNEQLPYFKKGFSFDDYCHNEKNRALKLYFDNLINLASQNKNVLFQCNRTSLRVKWFKENYPSSFHIYIVRDSKDQWESYLNGSSNIFVVMNLLTVSKNYNSPYFKKIGDEIKLASFNSRNIENEIKFYWLALQTYTALEHYRLFYFHWLVSLIHGINHSDLLININRFTNETSYRNNIVEKMNALVSECISFDDAKIRIYKKPSIHEKEASDIQKEIQSSVWLQFPNEVKRMLQKLNPQDIKYFKLDHLRHFSTNNKSPLLLYPNDRPAAKDQSAAGYKKLLSIVAHEFKNSNKNQKPEQIQKDSLSKKNRQRQLKWNNKAFGYSFRKLIPNANIQNKTSNGVTVDYAKFNSIPSIISIITPSYNHGEFILDTIRSVFEQKGLFFIDYIIMDGNSTDYTARVIEKWLKDLELKHDSIAIDGLRFYIKDDKSSLVGCSGVSMRFFSEKDEGQAHAINKGLKISKGDILCWLNSDDMYYNDMTVKKTLEFFQNSGAEFVYSRGCAMDNRRKIIKEEPYVTKYTQKDLKEVDFILQPAAFWSRKVFEGIGFLEESYNFVFDWEYWLRCSEKFELVFFDEITALNRYHPQMKTSNGGLVRKKEIVKLLKKNNSLSHRALKVYDIPKSLI